MIENTELAALNREFNRVGSMMHAATFKTRREEILARASQTAEAERKPIARTPPPAAPASNDDRPVSLRLLKNFAEMIGKATRDKVVAPTAASIVALEARNAELERRLASLESQTPDASLSTRLSACETRIGALSMLAGRGQSAEQVSEAENLIVRLKLLESRLASLQNVPRMQYAGVWVADRVYAEGSVTTLAGSMWHANKSTSTRPGGGGPDWTLCCKRGGNG